MFPPGSIDSRLEFQNCHFGENKINGDREEALKHYITIHDSEYGAHIAKSALSTLAERKWNKGIE